MEQMETQIFVQYLLSENQNLLFRYNHKKSVLFYYLQRLMEGLDNDELNHFYKNISMKYDERPSQVNSYQTTTPSQAIKDLLEVNNEINALNNHIQEDIMTLKEHFKEFLNKQANRNQTIPSKLDIKEMRYGNLPNTLDCQKDKIILSNVALETEIQNLLKSHKKLKEQLQFAHNHQHFNKNLIEELEEEVDMLHEKVKSHEERDNCNNPLEQVEEETKTVLETEAWKENINVISQQLCEEINRGDDLNGQLKKTQRLYFIYKNIIKNYCKETRALRDSVKKLEKKLENTQISLYKSSLKFFSPKWKRHQAEISLLISQKRLACDSAEDLKEQLDRAKYISSIFRIMVEKIQVEVDDLYEIIKWLDDRLQKISPSVCQKICQFLGLAQRQGEGEITILKSQKREAKCRVKDLRKQLLDGNHFYLKYEHLMGKLKEEKNILQKRLRTFDEKLKSTLQDERIRTKTER